MIDTILRGDGEYIITYIKNAPLLKKHVFLKDNLIREKLLLLENHYPFVWLIQSLNDDELIEFIDEDLQEKLVQNNRLVDKLNAMMNLEVKSKNKILSNPKLLSSIISNINELGIYIKNLDIEFSQSYLNYIISNNLNIDLISHLEPKTLNKLLETQQNIENLYDKFDSKLYTLLNSLTIELLLKNENFCNIFLNSYSYIIKDVVSKGIKIPENIGLNNKFLDTYLSMDDINTYRNSIDALCKNNYYLAQYIQKKEI